MWAIFQGQCLPQPASKLSEPISILIATGPFTTTDNLEYEPLTDLAKHLLREAPDVCILVIHVWFLCVFLLRHEYVRIQY